MSNNFIAAIATMIGVIIGAGILGIPFVVAKAGFWLGISYILGIGLLMLLVNLCLGEVALRTNAMHQLAGYAEKYLGVWGKRANAVSMVVGIYGALIGYIAGAGQVLYSLFPVNFVPQYGERISSLLSNAGTFWALVFFIVGAIVLFFGIRIMKAAEIFTNAVKLLLFAVLLLIIFYSGLIQKWNFSGVYWYNWYLPYGVVFFAFLGFATLPEVREILKYDAKKVKKAIIIGSLIPIVVYLLFAFAVVGVTGDDTTDVATIGLGKAIGPHAFWAGQLFALVALSTAFIGLGFALKEMYVLDFNRSEAMAWLLTVIVPLAIILFLPQTFIGALAITGAFAGGLQGILNIMMFYKAKKLGDRKPEYEIKLPRIVGNAICVLFAIGMIAAFLF